MICLTQSSSALPYRPKPTDKQPTTNEIIPTTTNEIIPTTQLHYSDFHFGAPAVEEALRSGCSLTLSSVYMFGVGPGCLHIQLDRGSIILYLPSFTFDSFKDNVY